MENVAENSHLVEFGRRVVVKPDSSVEIQNFPVRQPGKGEVMVKTVSALISAGTELGSQELSRTRDLSPGYSNAGRIVALGEEVEGFQIGDPVLSLGSHASYVTVSAAPQSLAEIPEGVSFDEASFGVLGSVSMHGVRKAKIEIGEFVAISGMGLVGQLTLQLASHTGGEALIAIDLCDMRLQVAKSCGATHILNPKSCDVQAEVNEITRGRGLDVIIEASGYPQALLSAFDLARIGGRIMALGSIWHRKVEVDFMPFHEKELTLIGCHQPKCPTTETIYFPWTQQYNRNQILRMISDGRLNVRRLITHKLPYTEAAEAYRLLRDEKDKSLGVVLSWE
ncbi:MAG: zinc-binding dehydrogenase [Candidatus Poribacteria bacterium]